LIALPAIGLVLVAAAWSGFWYFSAGKAQASLDEWRMREANAGRVYRCGEESFGGFPFRIEMHCRNPQVEDRAAHETTLVESGYRDKILARASTRWCFIALRVSRTSFAFFTISEYGYDEWSVTITTMSASRTPLARSTERKVDPARSRAGT
jgi:hypothetical protein